MAEERQADPAAVKALAQRLLPEVVKSALMSRAFEAVKEIQGEGINRPHRTAKIIVDIVEEIATQAIQRFS